MPRTLYLIVYNSRLFPAHWSLWIPSVELPVVGKRLHATGDAMNGFEIAFERNYNLTDDSRQYQLVELGQIPKEHVVDCKPSDGPSTDQTPLDHLERLLISVPAPGPSLVSSASRGQRQRVEIQNCQTWLRAAVAVLVENGIMDQSALQAVDDASKN